VFVDYSMSASTLADDNNEKSLVCLENVWSLMKPDDALIIYPIHLLTETAVPLFRMIKPFLNGDLNDRINSKTSESLFIKSLRKKIFDDIKIPSEVRQGTNIYPIMRKMRRFQKDTFVSGTIVSDMNHEYLGEQLHKTFGTKDHPNPSDYAMKKVDSLGLHSSLNNSEITLVIPGTYAGDINDELTRSAIIEYWETFFMLTGSKVRITDL